MKITEIGHSRLFCIEQSLAMNYLKGESLSRGGATRIYKPLSLAVTLKSNGHGLGEAAKSLYCTKHDP
jgi:hypothetical protein